MAATAADRENIDFMVKYMVGLAKEGKQKESDRRAQRKRGQRQKVPAVVRRRT